MVSKVHFSLIIDICTIQQETFVPLLQFLTFSVFLPSKTDELITDVTNQTNEQTQKSLDNQSLINLFIKQKNK